MSMYYFFGSPETNDTLLLQVTIKKRHTYFDPPRGKKIILKRRRMAGLLKHVVEYVYQSQMFVYCDQK